jgi:hypothetical protein
MPQLQRAAAQRLVNGFRTRSIASICYHCRYKQRLSDLRALRSRSPQILPRRRASTITSTTAINAPLDVQPAFKELYSALKGLETDASSYTNLSRVQLALRGLEGDNAVVRVAVLGLGKDGLRRAKDLAEMLLADPLDGKKEWEGRLEESGDGRGLLLRYFLLFGQQDYPRLTIDQVQ